MAKQYRLGELASLVGAEVQGDADRWIRGVATLGEAGEEDLSFLTNPRYRKDAESTRAGALLVPPGTELAGRDLLVAKDPYARLATILELFHPVEAPSPGVSPDARLGQDVTLGRDVHVGPFAVVGDGVELGNRSVVGAGCVLGRDCCVGNETTLHPRVVLYPRTRVGSRCIVHAGVVLGSDGFGFATVEGRHVKVPQVGRVVVEDDVEIGANSAVDRAMLGQTRIGQGSKIDDLVMIAHGVQLGRAALLAAQAGVAGSARLGERATLAGQSGVAGHLEIGDRVIVAAKTAVFGDVPSDSFVAGVPAVDHRRWKRSQALIKKLPDLQKEVRALRSRLAEIEATLDTED